MVLRWPGITNNAEIIDEYVKFLPVRDLDKYDEVLFILNAGPLTDSRTFSLITMNKKLIDSISRKEMHDAVVAYQTRIIDNTLASAIAEKNPTRAYSAAGYIRETWRHDYEQGEKAYNSRMLAYFKGIDDTARVLRTALNFYERYMNINADSVRNLSRITAERARSAANENAIRNLPPGAAIQSASYVFAVNTFSTALNQGAWTVYETGTKDPQFLTRAMLWSKRSIELNPLSSYYDTLAHILYRLEFYAEAESMQKKAIERAKAENRDPKGMQNELAKIQSRAL